MGLDAKVNKSARPIKNNCIKNNRVRQSFRSSFFVKWYLPNCSIIHCRIRHYCTGREREVLCQETRQPLHKWQRLGGRRHGFSDHHEKHGHWKQCGDAERDLFAGFAGRIKSKKGENRDQPAGHQIVKDVKQRPPPYHQVYSVNKADRLRTPYGWFTENQNKKKGRVLTWCPGTVQHLK